MARIVSVLALAPAEVSLLRNAWLRTSDRGPVPSSDDLGVSLRAAATLRRLGQPRMAYELAARDGRAALERARTARLPDRQLREVLAVAGDLLLEEEVKAALDFATTAQVRTGLLSMNMREHCLVSAAVDDRRARSRLAVADEAVQYAMGDIDRAHRSALVLLDEFAWLIRSGWPRRSGLWRSMLACWVTTWGCRGHGIDCLAVDGQHR